MSSPDLLGTFPGDATPDQAQAAFKELEFAALPVVGWDARRARRVEELARWVAEYARWTAEELEGI